MLKQFDVLIGLATAMTLISLIIMVLSQTILALLNRRGKSLCDGLEVMFKTLCPELVKKVENQSRLKRLGTSLWESLKGLAAWLWPFSATTKKTTAKDGARALAEAVLCHPIISDSSKSGTRRQMASTIRPNELLSILEKLAFHQDAAVGGNANVPGDAQANALDGGNANAPANAKVNAPAKDKADTKPGDEKGSNWAGTELESAFTNIQETANTILNALRQPEKVTSTFDKLNGLIASLSDEGLKTQIKTSLQPFEEGLKTTAGTVVKDVDLALENTKKWFGMAEQRAAEWFTTHAQQCNVILAILLTVGMQLDVIVLYNKLNADDKYRAAMVAAAGKVEEEAAEIGKQAGEPQPAVSADTTEPKASKDGARPQTDPTEKLDKTLKFLVAEAEKSGFQLFPSDGPHGFWQRVGFTNKKNEWDFSHFAGMALFVALLSLGAPFWFNLLKTLTNFRPAIAKNAEDEAKKEKEAKAAR